MTDQVGKSFLSLFDVLEKFTKVDIEEGLILDMSKIQFIHPFLVLPICSIINHIPFSERKLEFRFNQNTESYLNTIFFHNGFDAIASPTGTNYLSQFQTKTYLPICRIPTSTEHTKIREQLLTTFENIAIRQLQISGQMISVIKYLIGEAIDNIVEHAEVENGWIMVQNYPAKGYLDICISETGIGILSSYKKFEFPSINNDSEAIKQAINGKSTKQISETRGYGIDTSRRMLVDGLNGEYFLMSGSSIYIYTHVFEQIIPLDRNIFWPGTILALRIPKIAPANFNYTNYLE